MSSLASPRNLALLLLPVLVSVLYGPALQRSVSVLGVFRAPNSSVVENPAHLVYIPDTTHCEDLHYYAPANVLFSACADAAETRHGWFPPLTNFDDPIAGLEATGSIRVIGAGTHKAQRLTLEDFEGPLIPHGIDVVEDPDADKVPAVYIFVVNHVPDPAYVEWKRSSAAHGQKTPEPTNKSASRVDIFHHLLGASSARHVRSVQHPLIATPNDIFAVSPRDFYVTNDHHYREGVMRIAEDVFSGATWSTTIHVKLEGAEVRANVALTGLHNNNGLGHGNTSDQVLIGSAASGTMHLATFAQREGALEVLESINLDSAIDNPTYFRDPYATRALDLSGYVNGGVSNGYKVVESAKHPNGLDGSMVWITRPQSGSAQGWDNKLLFQDDGSRIRAASVAVLVAIDPALEGGQRKAWLYVSGFVSKNILAVKIDLV